MILSTMPRFGVIARSPALSNRLNSDSTVRWSSLSIVMASIATDYPLRTWSNKPDRIADDSVVPGSAQTSRKFRNRELREPPPSPRTQADGTRQAPSETLLVTSHPRGNHNYRHGPRPFWIRAADSRASWSAEDSSIAIWGDNAPIPPKGAHRWMQPLPSGCVANSPRYPALRTCPSIGSLPRGCS